MDKMVLYINVISAAVIDGIIWVINGPLIIDIECDWSAFQTPDSRIGNVEFKFGSKGSKPQNLPSGKAFGHVGFHWW